MGLFHFALPPDLTPAEGDAARRGWLLNGYDNTPAVTRRGATAAGLSYGREDAESSYLELVWPTGDAPRTVSTSTLRQRPEPYPLTVELARGAVNRVRSFAAELAASRVELPPPLAADLLALTKRFGRCLPSDDGPPAERAADVLAAAGPVADRLAALLAAERYKSRPDAAPLDTRFGCRLSRPLSPADADAYAASFNAVRLVPDWAAIEPTEAGFNWSTLDPLVRWAAAAGLHVSIGPILDLTDGRFPDWVRGWAGDLANLTAFLSDFVATVVARYRSACKRWHLLSGFNHAPALGLNDDDRFNLTVRLMETAADVDPDSDWILGLARPWGEYLSEPGSAYPPFALADALLRRDLPLSGLELELLSGPSARCGPPRDALDVVHLLEAYDALTLPLDVTFGHPLPHPHALGLAETLLAGPTVRGVYWESFTPDDPANRVPGSDLLSAPDTLAAFRRLRSNWLR